MTGFNMRQNEQKYTFFLYILILDCIYFSSIVETCDHCSRELTEDGCTAFGKVFHKECFRCHGCKKRLDGKFFSKDDNAYCAKCHKVTYILF